MRLLVFYFALTEGKTGFMPSTRAFKQSEHKEPQLSHKLVAQHQDERYKYTEGKTGFMPLTRAFKQSEHKEPQLSHKLVAQHQDEIY